jgi:hypothetical protein
MYRVEGRGCTRPASYAGLPTVRPDGRAYRRGQVRETSPMSAGLTSWREPGAGPRSVTISRRAGSPLAETPEGYERGGKAALVKQRRSMPQRTFRILLRRRTARGSRQDGSPTGFNDGGGFTPCLKQPLLSSVPPASREKASRRTPGALRGAAEMPLKGAKYGPTLQGKAGRLFKTISTTILGCPGPDNRKRLSGRGRTGFHRWSVHPGGNAVQKRREQAY